MLKITEWETKEGKDERQIAEDHTYHIKNSAIEDISLVRFDSLDSEDEIYDNLVILLNSGTILKFTVTVEDYKYKALEESINDVIENDFSDAEWSIISKKLSVRHTEKK